MNRSLLKHIAVRGKAILMQELSPLAETPQAAAYSAQLWFMRLTALRFLDANGWLPDGMPLFPAHIPRRARVLTLCRQLAETPALAGLFGETADAMLPDTILSENGAFMEQLMQLEDDAWQGFPEILGWLYQYQNTELREQTFRMLRSRVRIPPEQIPAATQMFTPDWIVRCMTQNALGALRKPPKNWNYCIPEAPQPPHVRRTLKKLTDDQRTRPVTELRVLDPCMGTGHILAYVFDALMELYLREGIAPADAAVQILERNLCGLDIDAGACHLAAFVLLMKARAHDPDILSRDIRPQLCHFAGLEDMEDISPEYQPFAAQFAGAACFGSLLKPEKTELPEDCSGTLARLGTLSRMLNRQYDAVITNPPYMSRSSMDPMLSAFLRAHYPDSRSDLFAAFMERCTSLTAPHGCCAMITQHSWMFLSSYETLRRKMQQYTLRSLVHLGARAFAATDVGIIVQTAAFVCMGSHVPAYRTAYLRLTEAEDKERAFFDPENRYVCDTGQFEGIAGMPVCYWISNRMRTLLQKPRLGTHCPIRQGMTTSDNRRFLRYWHEVTPGSIAFGCADADEAAASGKRWFPYNKGGRTRRWYGNQSHVVNFYRNGEEMRAFHAELNKQHSGGRIKNESMYFRQAVTWQFITESSRFCVRWQPAGSLFDVSGSSLFPDAGEMEWIMGFLSSKAAMELLRVYNPTMNFQVENIASLPWLPPDGSTEEVRRLVQDNIRIAREDWDSSEQSWDFRCHPLVRTGVTRLSEAFAQWELECWKRRERMCRNEQQLNTIFLRICGLEEELSPEVAAEELTLHTPELQADVRSLLSFAVGCLFGRYTLPGFAPLAENFLPMEAMVPEIERFLTALYGAETLEENLRFIAGALGGGENAREVIAHELALHFYAQHCRTYHQRPIYWMADSGRRHACRGLMYLHRMDGGQLSLLERHAAECGIRLEEAIRAQKEAIKKIKKKTIAAKMRSRLTALEAELQELTAFRTHITELAGTELRPDDGVLRNYEAFRRILAAIR